MIYISREIIRSIRLDILRYVKNVVFIYVKRFKFPSRSIIEEAWKLEEYCHVLDGPKNRIILSIVYPQWQGDVTVYLSYWTHHGAILYFFSKCKRSLVSAPRAFFVSPKPVQMRTAFSCIPAARRFAEQKHFFAKLFLSQRLVTDFTGCILPLTVIPIISI